MSWKHAPFRLTRRRIHAGANGVYDAVYDDAIKAWRIQFAPYACHMLLGVPADVERSETTYDTPHAAALAFERRETIRYCVMA